jgi:hypothetical protein
MRVAVPLIADRYCKRPRLLIAQVNKAECRLASPPLEQPQYPLDAARIAEQIWQRTRREQYVAPAADLQRMREQLDGTVGQARRQHSHRWALSRVCRLTIQRDEQLEVLEDLLVETCARGFPGHTGYLQRRDRDDRERGRPL